MGIAGLCIDTRDDIAVTFLTEPLHSVEGIPDSLLFCIATPVAKERLCGES